MQVERLSSINNFNDNKLAMKIRMTRARGLAGFFVNDAGVIRAGQGGGNRVSDKRKRWISN